LQKALIQRRHLGDWEVLEDEGEFELATKYRSDLDRLHGKYVRALAHVDSIPGAFDQLHPIEVKFQRLGEQFLKK
jgi:hypothetical protein